MASIRKNVTFTQEVLDRAQAVMGVRAIDEFSQYLATLIREEYERRGAPAAPKPSYRAAIKQHLSSAAQARSRSQSSKR